MNSEPVQWSEEKQKVLQENLVGRWADDIWIFTSSNQSKRRQRAYLRFTLSSLSLKTEIKYAVWSKFDSGECKMNASHVHLSALLSCLTEWFNHFDPPIRSLMEKTLEEWETSFRDYLIQTMRFKYSKYKDLSATQEIIEYSGEDRRIGLLRQLYAIICAAYDERPEMKKDIWDMRKMGLAVNLTQKNYLLNFNCIAQPWLVLLAKEYMKYNIAINSPGDCYVKLHCIRTFSEYLSEKEPTAYLSASGVNRLLIVRYISFLHGVKIGNSWRSRLLSNLRIFLETCACRLEIEDISRERLIFNEDFPKLPQPKSREIPEGVLAQLREHLNTLPTSILRMVVILLECGMRISELCSLPLDCLTCDEKKHWSLHFYQTKFKQEHTIPLVDETVVQTIQAQQQSILEQWGTESPYLFPSIKSHLLPFKSDTFTDKLNRWAREQKICDSKGRLYHFQTHQFRHTVGMQLIHDDVPIDVIGRLLGHRSLRMTEIYARKRNEQVSEDIERAGRKRKTVNYQGQIVHGDARANAPDVQLLRKGIRGQTLPVGGCGRLLALGECEHANKCLTCPSWLTSTEDLPGLKAFYGKAIHLEQRAHEAGNSIVLQNQNKIIPLLAVRINSLEEMSMNDSLSADNLLSRLRLELVGGEACQKEALEAGFIQAAKYLERKIEELKARIADVERSL